MNSSSSIPLVSDLSSPSMHLQFALSGLVCHSCIHSLSLLLLSSPTLQYHPFFVSLDTLHVIVPSSQVAKAIDQISAIVSNAGFESKLVNSQPGVLAELSEGCSVEGIHTIEGVEGYERNDTHLLLLFTAGAELLTIFDRCKEYFGRNVSLTAIASYAAESTIISAPQEDFDMSTKVMNTLGPWPVKSAVDIGSKNPPPITLAVDNAAVVDPSVADSASSEVVFFQVLGDYFHHLSFAYYSIAHS